MLVSVGWLTTADSKNCVFESFVFFICVFHHSRVDAHSSCWTCKLSHSNAGGGPSRRRSGQGGELMDGVLNQCVARLLVLGQLGPTRAHGT